MMKTDFRHMKEQIKADDAAVSAVMTRLTALPAPTPVPSYRRVAVMAASLSLVALAVVAAAGIGSAFLQNSQPTPPVPPLIGTEGDMQTNATDTQAPQGETAPLPETEDAATTGTVETTPVPVETETAAELESGAGGFEGSVDFGEDDNKKVFFSSKLQGIMKLAAPDELISVELYGSYPSNMIYDEEYYGQVFDGRTLKEWIDERERLWARRFFLYGQFKYDSSSRTPELEQEYEVCETEIERLTELIDREEKKHENQFMEDEIAWLKTFGIEAVHQGRFLYFSATAEKIQSITGGRGSYELDIASFEIEDGFEHSH